MPEIITLPCRPELVATARHAVRALLGEVPEDAADNAELVVSELMTNSIFWSRSGDGGSVEVAVDHEPGTNTARLEVIDAGPRPDGEVDREDADQYGRGLLIVGALAKLTHSINRKGQTWAAELSWN